MCLAKKIEQDQQPSKDLVEYAESHTRREAYLYNNLNYFSNFITVEEYEVNHTYIKSLPDKK